jgi:hypothetical protein
MAARAPSKLFSAMQMQIRSVPSSFDNRLIDLDSKMSSCPFSVDENFTPFFQIHERKRLSIGLRKPNGLSVL